MQAFCLLRPTFQTTGDRGIEPRARVLETPMLPLHQSPESAVLQAFRVCTGRLSGGRVWAVRVHCDAEHDGRPASWAKDTRASRTGGASARSPGSGAPATAAPRTDEAATGRSPLNTCGQRHAIP